MTKRSPAKKAVKKTKAKVTKPKARKPSEPATPPAPPAPPPTRPDRAAVSMLSVPPQPAAVLATRLPPQALEYQEHLKTLGGEIALLTLTGPESLATAHTFLTKLKTLGTNLEEVRKLHTKPLREQLERINALFKPVTTQLDTFTTALKGKVLKFQTEAAALQQAEQQKLLQAATKADAEGDHDAALALASESIAIATPIVKTTMVDTGGKVQMKNRWTYEVTDLSLIPREYMSLDPSKVTAAIRAGMRDVVDGDGHVVQSAIPGVRIFEKAELAVTGE